MKRGIIWGTGFNGMSYPVDPDQLGNASPSWAQDIKALAPWALAPFVPDETESRSWISGEGQKEAPLILTGPCSSAMDVAWHFISKNVLPEWGSVLALNQWNGRGQLGRMWLSPAGNFYYAARFPSPSGSWGNLLPLIVGYSLAKSFARIHIHTDIKWPNDLVIENKKVGGILIEKKEDMVVVGVGINLVSSPGKEELRHDNVIPSAALQDFGYDFTPLGLWQNLMAPCRKIFEEIVRTDIPSGLITKLHEHLAFKDDRVNITDRDNKVFIATIMGLAEDGGLKLLVNNEIKVIQSGSICPLAG